MPNEHSQKNVHPRREENQSKKMARSRSASETRAALLAAARLRFARDGYEATTLREIAAAVGVNVALIPRYFGSKQELFQAVVAVGHDHIAQAMQGLPEQLGKHLLEHVLADPAGSDHDLFATLLRSSDYPPAAAYLRNLLSILSTELTAAPDYESLLRGDVL